MVATLFLFSFSMFHVGASLGTYMTRGTDIKDLGFSL